MSSSAEVLDNTAVGAARVRENPRSADREVIVTEGWNPEEFMREQIRGLVRRVFFAKAVTPARQVLFCGTEASSDVASLCSQVGHALARETSAHVAVVSRDLPLEETTFHSRYGERTAIKSWSQQLSPNLWRVPQFGLRFCTEEPAAGHHWVCCLSQLRKEFEYAVIHGPVAGLSSEAGLLGQLADGVVLVLAAHSTRKATARKIKETLEASQARILGTVLSERTFPVPEGIYRRF